jgi:hypothetical protein
MNTDGASEPKKENGETKAPELGPSLKSKIDLRKNVGYVPQPALDAVREELHPVKQPHDALGEYSTAPLGLDTKAGLESWMDR